MAVRYNGAVSTIRTPSGKTIKRRKRRSHPEWAATVTRLVNGSSTIAAEAALWGMDEHAMRQAYRRAIGTGYTQSRRAAQAWGYFTDTLGTKGVIHYGDPLIIVHDNATNGALLEVRSLSECADPEVLRRAIQVGRSMWLVVHGFNGAPVYPLVVMADGTEIQT
jgi:hypothetical protein